MIPRAAFLCTGKEPTPYRGAWRIHSEEGSESAGSIIVKQALRNAEMNRSHASPQLLQLRIYDHFYHGRCVYVSGEQAPRELDKARAAVAREELDILVYPDVGMESLTYLMAFARLAPVQVRCLHQGRLAVPRGKNASATWA